MHKNYTVTLSSSDLKQLRELAEQLGVSRADATRLAIRAAADAVAMRREPPTPAPSQEVQRAPA